MGRNPKGEKKPMLTVNRVYVNSKFCACSKNTANKAKNGKKTSKSKDNN